MGQKRQSGQDIFRRPVSFKRLTHIFTTIARIDPLTYGVDGLRATLLGNSLRDYSFDRQLSFLEKRSISYTGYMSHHDKTKHQQQQLAAINEIDQQAQDNNIQSSVVTPVEDFGNDTRICLTSVHFPKQEFIDIIRQQIIDPLKTIAPEHYYYDDDSLHMTIKNIRSINDPPLFSGQDIQTVKNVFDEIIPLHHSFNVYFYRLLIFPYNLALMGTTDEELDAIILDLDDKLKERGIEDDKKYINPRYFFANSTLARFNSVVGDSFREKAKEISDSLSIPVYTVDSVTLLTANAVMKKRQNIKTWSLAG